MNHFIPSTVLHIVENYPKNRRNFIFLLDLCDLAHENIDQLNDLSKINDKRISKMVYRFKKRLFSEGLRYATILNNTNSISMYQDEIEKLGLNWHKVMQKLRKKNLEQEDINFKKWLLLLFIILSIYLAITLLL